MKLSSTSSLAKTMFSICTTDTLMDGSNGSSSSISRARLGRQQSPVDVDEEYGRAFKSRSFLDLWSHANRRLRNTFSSHKLSSRPSSSFKDEDALAAMDESACSYTALNYFVLEPSPETLVHAGHRRRRSGACAVDTIDAVLRRSCSSTLTSRGTSARHALLAAAGAAGRHHLVLLRLLHRLDNDGCERAAAARDALERHVRLDNPLSPAGGRLAAIRDSHTRCAPLSLRLAAARAGFGDSTARLGSSGVLPRQPTAIVGASAKTVVAAVVLAAEAVVGVGAAAAMSFCFTRPSMRRTSALKKLVHQSHDGRQRRHRHVGEEAVVDVGFKLV